MNAVGAIGLFDSGVGGLSVARAVLERLPHESLHYVADSANCPYGDRSEAEVRQLSIGISRYLLARGCKLIVVACNTASAAALNHLRAVMPQVPFVGMVPAVKPAALHSVSHVVGVLATPGTFQGRLYQQVVDQFASSVHIVASVCPGLVEQIERAELDSPATRAALLPCLRELLKAGADTVVLGCTHYPLVKELVAEIVGPGVEVVEPSDAIARQVQHVLADNGLLSADSIAPRHVFASTGNPDMLARVLLASVGLEVPVDRIEWRDGRLCCTETTGGAGAPPSS